MPPLFFFLFPNRFLNVLDCPIAERKEEKKTVQTDCYSNEERARSYTSRTYKKKKKISSSSCYVSRRLYMYTGAKRQGIMLYKGERERETREGGGIAMAAAMASTWHYLC